jgi:hypothetical protein
MTRFILVCILVTIGPCALDAQPSCQSLASQTVRIQRGTAQGAGVVLRSDGQTAWIATAKHVIDGQGNIQVQFAGGARSFLATLEYPRRDSLGTLDVAVLKVSSTIVSFPKLPAAVLRSSGIQSGERVSYVGHPMGVNWQCYLNKDVITRLSYREDDRLFLFSNPTVREGLSGGPVFDQQGSLIGLITSESSTKDSVAVRISSVLRIMTDEMRVDLGQPEPRRTSAGEATDAGESKTSRSAPLKVVDTVKFEWYGEYTYDLYKCQHEREMIVCLYKLTRLRDGSGDYKYDSSDYLFTSKLIDNFNIEHKQLRGYFLNGRGQRQQTANLAKDDSIWVVQEFDGASPDIKTARIVITGRSVQLRGPVL